MYPQRVHSYLKKSLSTFLISDLVNCVLDYHSEMVVNLQHKEEFAFALEEAGLFQLCFSEEKGIVLGLNHFDRICMTSTIPKNWKYKSFYQDMYTNEVNAIAMDTKEIYLSIKDSVHV